MVALQSKGSNSSLNNLRNSLATADNPRRGSATGVYGLPVPPDNLKLGGSHLTGDSCTGTPNNSARNSPVCWQTPSLAKTNNRNNSDHLPETKARGFGAFNSIYDVRHSYPNIRENMSHSSFRKTNPKTPVAVTCRALREFSRY